MLKKNKNITCKVLIIDDDEKLCRLVRAYLEPMGFTVAAAHRGPEGLETALSGNFDAVLLDVMLPGMDGFEVLRRLRAGSRVPVLMFTARGDETDRIVGLEMGADDYLPKTFSSRELLARIRAVVRRSQDRENATAEPRPPAPPPTLKAGELAIDLAARQASLGAQDLGLTAIEFDLLVALVENRGRVLSRDRLLDLVSGRDYTVFDRSIDVHISSLRRKLGNDPRRPGFIKTVRSAGYMFLKPA